MLLRSGNWTDTSSAEKRPTRRPATSMGDGDDRLEQVTVQPLSLSQTSDSPIDTMSPPQSDTPNQPSPPPSSENLTPPPVVPQQIPAPYVVWVHREQNIRKFFGEPGEYPAEDFKAEVERSWRAQPCLTPQQKMDLIWSNIGPSVQAELRCQDLETQEDPVKAMTKIIEIFGERRSPSQLLQRLYALQQWTGESVRSYSHRVSSAYQALTKRQAALGEAGYPDSIARDHFQQSLTDPILVKMLREKICHTPSLRFKDIREVAIRWGDEDPPHQQASASTNLIRTPAPAARDELKELKETVADLTQKLDSLISFQTQQGNNQGPRHTRKPVKCYNCGREGHIRRFCKDKGNDLPPRS